MEIKGADRSLVRAGFVLFTLSLFTGFAIPAFLNPRMAVAAHLGGLMNALVLIALGLAWGLLAFGPRQARLTRGAFLFAAFAGWVASSLAAAWGTNRMTPLSGAGYGAAPWQELIVQALQVLLAVALVGGSISVVFALRPRPASHQ
jgi:hydroxylaminobenzene mutase